MAPPVLHRVIWGTQTPPTPAHASLLHIQPAILHAHRRHKVKSADYPAILPVSTSSSSSSSVRGTLVTGLTDGDVWRLDLFEGHEYARRKVRVRVLVGKDEGKGVVDKGKEQGMGDLTIKEEDNVEGEEVEAETYIWVAGAHRLEADEWDFNEFVRDKMKRWVGGDAAQTDDGFQGKRLSLFSGTHNFLLRVGVLSLLIIMVQTLMTLWQLWRILRVDGEPMGVYHVN